MKGTPAPTARREGGRTRGRPLSRRRAPVAPAAEEENAATEEAGSSSLLAAYGLYCADEALSAVRHDVLNRMTAVGALSYELRRHWTAAADRASPEPTAPGSTSETGAAARAAGAGGAQQRLEDLNRQLTLLTEAVSRRLAPSPTPGQVQVAEALDRVRPLLREPVVLRDSSSPGAALAVAMPGQQLALVLLAVLDNAARAAGGARTAGRAGVELQVRAAPEGQVSIQVDDRGPGLKRESRERAFERFFTTQPGHAGLGLCVARTLVRRAGGEITLQSRSGDRSGTRVTITLPAAAPGPAAVLPSEDRPARPRGGRGRAPRAEARRGGGA